MQNPYDILGVPTDASHQQINERYRFLSHAYHPDKFSSPKHKSSAENEFKRINEAYALLSDPAARRSYDASPLASSAGPTERTKAPPPRTQPEPTAAKRTPTPEPSKTSPEPRLPEDDPVAVLGRICLLFSVLCLPFGVFGGSPALSTYGAWMLVAYFAIKIINILRNDRASHRPLASSAGPTERTKASAPRTQPAPTAEKRTPTPETSKTPPERDTESIRNNVPEKEPFYGNTWGLLVLIQTVIAAVLLLYTLSKR